MFKTLANAWKVKDIRTRLLFVLFLVVTRCSDRKITRVGFPDLVVSLTCFKNI